MFFLISPLNILHTFFCLSALSLISPCSLPAAVCRLRASLLHSPGARPSVSLSPPFLPSACPPILLPAVCSVAAVRLLLCSVVSPSVSPSPCLDPSSVCAPLKLSGGLLRVLSCVLWQLPSLVSHQAQDGVAVWADAPRICPRPCLLLPMCCRVFRCLSRGLSCLLPCVVWWQ